MLIPQERDVRSGQKAMDFDPNSLWSLCSSARMSESIAWREAAPNAPEIGLGTHGPWTMINENYDDDKDDNPMVPSWLPCNQQKHFEIPQATLSHHTKLPAWAAGGNKSEKELVGDLIREAAKAKRISSTSVTSGPESTKGQLIITQVIHTNT